MSKFIQSPIPFLGARVYGPYLDSMQRYCVKLHTGQGVATMTVARYVLSVGLRRKLLDSEHADHIDGNGIHDHWRNLQVLSSSDNEAKGSAKRSIKRTYFKCALCQSESKRDSNKCVPSKTGNTRVLFCSRKCAHEFNSRSSRYLDKQVVRAGIALNDSKSKVTSTFNTEISGERIKRFHRDLKAVVLFLKRTDTSRSKIDFGKCKCGKPLKNRRDKHCSKGCSHKSKSSSTKPKSSVLAKKLKAKIPFTRLGILYGVSDTTVKKWARAYGLI